MDKAALNEMREHHCTDPGCWLCGARRDADSRVDEQFHDRREEK